MLDSAPIDGERGLFTHDSDAVQLFADENFQDMENPSQNCDISSPGLESDTPQDALQQQLAEMQDALQRTWDVNEDLQAKLEATERSSAEYSSKLSLKLYYAAQKAETEVKVADEALRKLRDQQQNMQLEMGNKAAELLYEQAKAAAHQQNLEAAQTQHAQEEWALQMQLKQERIRAEKAEGQAEEAKGRADKAEGYLNEANAQVDNLERQLTKACEELRKMAIGINPAINPHHEGKVHWAGSLRTAQHQITRMRLLLAEALAHTQEVPESPESLAHNDQYTCQVPSMTPNLPPHSVCDSPAPNTGTTWSLSSGQDGSDAFTLSPITPFEGVLQQVPSMTPTLPPHSVCDSPAPNSGTTWSLSSGQDGSDASTLSPITPFEVVLQQMVANPSPATAAAMACSPMPSSGQLVAAPGQDIASGAAVASPWTDAATPEHLWDTSTLTPATTSSVSFMEMLSPDMAAQRVGSPLAGQLVANLVLSPKSNATTPEHLWDTTSLMSVSTCSLSLTPSRGSMSAGGALLWKVPSPAATFTQEPLWETSCHTITLTTPTTATSSASSLSWCDSCSSSRSSCSSFEGVLREMVATPGPATAAALVRTPPAASPGLMETQGLDSPAAVQFSPFSAQSDCESPGSSSEYDDPYLRDFSSPVQDLFPPAHTLFGESEWESSSCDSAIDSLSRSSSLTGSVDSWLSDKSVFEEILQQMVATPSPATAAAMVHTPPASSPGLMQTPGSESPAAVLCSPAHMVTSPRSDSAAPRVRSPFAGQLVAAPGQATAASSVSRASSGQLVAALTPNTTAARGGCPPSPQSVPSAGPDNTTAAPEASRPLPRQQLATTSVSPGGPPSAVHSPTFSGSPVAGLCRSGLAGSHIRVRSTKKQQARQEAVAQRMATTSSGHPPHQRTATSPTVGLQRVASLKRRPSVRSGSKLMVSKHNSRSDKENSPLPSKVATPSLGQPETPFQSKVETPLFGSTNTPAKVARVELSSPALTSTGTANAPCRTPLAPLSGGVNSAPGITPQALQCHTVAVPIWGVQAPAAPIWGVQAPAAPIWGLQAPAATMEVPLAAATLSTAAASRLSPPVASSSATSSSRQITPGVESADSQAANTTADVAKEVQPRGSRRRTAFVAAPVASQIVTRSQAAAQKHVERMQTRSMQIRRLK